MSVAIAVVLGLVLVAVGKVSMLVISVNASGQENPAAAMKNAAYWSLMQVGGALIAAMALVWFAMGQRSDRVVAAGALIAAALLMAGQV